MSYTNPADNIYLRSFLQKESEEYEFMLTLLHTEVRGSQCNYYCGSCHSIEIYPTIENQKSNYIYYTKVLFQIYFEIFLNNFLGKERQLTVAKFLPLAKHHSHVEWKIKESTVYEVPFSSSKNLEYQVFQKERSKSTQGDWIFKNRRRSQSNLLQKNSKPKLSKQ